jgi:hypothetical protein
MCPRHWRLAQRLEHLFDIQEIMSSILIVPTICVVRAFGFRPRYNTPSLHNCGEERGVLWHAYRLASGECWPIIRSSSSGLGILTFNQEDAGSNPAGRTNMLTSYNGKYPIVTYWERQFDSVSEYQI